MVIRRLPRATFAGALSFLLICGLLVILAPSVRAAVTLLYFTATPGSDTILVVWEMRNQDGVTVLRMRGRNMLGRRS